MSPITVSASVDIATPAPAIWQALTTPEELIRWYAPGCRWEISALAPGATVRFFNSETDIQLATITAADPPRRLALRWQLDADGQAVSLENDFALEPGPAGTRVTVRQAGYEALPPPLRETWRAQDEGAMAAIAQSLKAHVEARSEASRA